MRREIAGLVLALAIACGGAAGCTDGSDDVEESTPSGGTVSPGEGEEDCNDGVDTDGDGDPDPDPMMPACAVEGR